MVTSTLMLSRDFLPLQVVNWQRAMTLVCQGKARVVEEYDQVAHPGSGTRFPAVISLLDGFRRDDRGIKFSRTNVYARDKHTCQYCGERFSAKHLTYDHVIPKSQGGKTTWTNIVTCCDPCNGFKADRTPERAGMRLLRRPVEPDYVPRKMLQVTQHEAPEQWRGYLLPVT